MREMIKELTPFLKDAKPEVRKMAIEHITSFTTNSEALEYFRADESKVIVQLQALCHDEMNIAHAALKALVNISAEPERCGNDLHNKKFLWTVVKMILHPNFLLADLACMLLSNLVKDLRAVPDILQLNDDPKIQGLFVTQLLEVFCRGPAHNCEAEYHFLGSVFADITRTQHGRDFFLNKQRGYPLKKLLSFTEHANLIRRGGVIATIKNCCFDVVTHGAMLTHTEIDILPSLLLPLAGPEELSEEDMDGMPDELQLLEPTKTRESDPHLRKMLVDSLLLMTSTRGGRDLMRLRKVYPIIRELHLAETDEQCEIAESELVQMLMREERREVLADEEVGVIEEVLMEKASEVVGAGKVVVEPLL